MEIDQSGKGLPGKGATSGSDCLTPQNQHGNVDNELDISVRRSALNRTPVKQAVDEAQDHEGSSEPGNPGRTSGAPRRASLSPDLEFLRSLTQISDNTPSSTAAEATKDEDVILVNDMSDERSDNSPGDPFQTKKKRKRSSGRSPELTHNIELTNSIILLNEQIIELIDFGKRNQNVHKHVKMLARKLRGTAEKVAMDFKRTEADKRERIIEYEQRNKLLQVKTEELEKVNAEHVEKQKRAPVLDTICKICKKITEDDIDFASVDPGDLNTFRLLLTKPWPVNAFKHTNLQERDSIRTLPNHVVIMSDRLFIDKEEGKPARMGNIEKEILSQFPDLDNEPPTKCSGGYNITLEEVTNCRIKGTNKNLEKKRTISVMLRHDNERDNMEKAHGQLLELKQTMLETEVGKTTLIPPAYIDTNTLRKIIECVFKETQLKIQIVAEKGALGSYAKATRTKARPNRGEAIIVEASESKGYDSLLGTLREKMNPSSAAAIKGVKKTANGNLLLQIRGEANAADLRGQVTEILDTAKIRIADGQTRKTLFIRGIDSMATTKEIRGALFSSSNPEYPEDVKMTVNRSARGQQTAVITMVTKDADKLLTLRTTRIGFSDCHIQERIIVDRCYRCWEFGHNARACANKVTDLSNCCYKCGLPGHHKAKCESAVDFCPTCKVEGHQSGTGRCKFFRAALNKEKRKKDGLRRESMVLGPETAINYD